MTTWCLIPNLALYLCATLLYLAIPVRSAGGLTESRRLSLENMGLTLTALGLVLQIIYVAYHYIQGGLLFEPPSDLLAFLSVGLVLLFLWLAFKEEWQGVGVFFVPSAFLLFLFSLKTGGTAAPFLISFANSPALVAAHLFFVVLSFLFFFGGLLLGIVVWVHERKLKTKQWDSFSLSLPPLVRNEKKVVLWLRLGLVFLTLVLLSGVMLMKIQALSARSAVHIGLAFIFWIFYAVKVLQKKGMLRGANLLLLSLAGFVSLFSLFLWN